MINLYIGDFDYDSNYRPYLVDLLKPFFPEKNLEKYRLSHIDIEIVQSRDESNFFLLPFCWNYYLKTDTISVAEKLIEQACECNKKIFIWVTGDYYCLIPQFDNIIGFYTSPYQSLQNVRTIALPVIIRDPLPYLEIDTINLRDFNVVPSVGFCGQSDSNLFVSSIKITKLAWQNLSYALNVSKYYPGPFLPPTYLRTKILDILDNTVKINTELIRRNRYQGGEKKNGEFFAQLRKEFYQNIDNTNYTLCIRGTGNFSARFYETLALGRIPIFINTDCILPFDDIIEWKKHIIWIEQNEISDINSKILKFHNGLTQDSFTNIQNENRQIWEQYFSFPGFIQQLISYLKKEIK